MREDNARSCALPTGMRHSSEPSVAIEALLEAPAYVCSSSISSGYGGSSSSTTTASSRARRVGRDMVRGQHPSWDYRRFPCATRKGLGYLWQVPWVHDGYVGTPQQTSMLEWLHCVHSGRQFHSPLVSKTKKYTNAWAVTSVLRTIPPSYDT
jgi:hypothetical protein